MKMRKRWLVRALATPPGRALLAPNMRFRLQKWQVASPAWGDRPPLRIGILSDLHWGYAPVSASMLAAAKARLQATNPDLIVFLGDLAEGRSISAKQASLPVAAKALAGMRAPLGAYAILGNHDWHDDPEAQKRRQGPVKAAELLENAGFHVLQNAAHRPHGGGFWLAGLDSQQAFKGGKDEPRRLGAHDVPGTLAQAGSDDPVILLAHEPDVFPELNDPRVVLTLSGHMHGGQIRPFGRAIYAPSRHGTRYAYGHYRQDGRHLVVSGGLGCSTIPLRIGIVPEITVVDLSTG